MGEDILNTFQYRLINEMNRQCIKQVTLCKMTGIKKASINHYVNGENLPNQERIYLIAKALGVNPSWLMGFDVPKYESEAEEEKGNYYIDKKTAETAQLIRSSKELALLFDVAKDASPEDLKTVQTMLLALKRKENNTNQE